MMSMVTMCLALVLAAPAPKAPPPPQPAFTAAEAESFVNRWMCDHYGRDPDENAMLATRPKGPPVELYPVDKKRGVYVGVNGDDGGFERGAATPARELVWARSVREMAPAFMALTTLDYLPAPKTCARGACLFVFPDASEAWFALRRDKKKELIVGLFLVQADKGPTADPLFAGWLDGIDQVYGAATAAK